MYYDTIMEHEEQRHTARAGVRSNFLHTDKMAGSYFKFLLEGEVNHHDSLIE